MLFKRILIIVQFLAMSQMYHIILWQSGHVGEQEDVPGPSLTK
jgi:hypothetical protein